MNKFLLAALLVLCGFRAMAAASISQVLGGTTVGSTGSAIYYQFPNTGTPNIVWTLRVPPDYSSGTFSLQFENFPLAGYSGNAKYTLSVACLSNGSNAASPTFNTASSVTLSITGANQTIQDGTISAIDATGCSARSPMVVKMTRDNTVGSNSATAVAAGFIVLYYTAVQ